jgi:HrpA-like RNA helicase
MKLNGVLDPVGKHTNPFTGEKYSDNYKELSKFWSSLPVYKDKKSIIKKIVDNQVILIISGTGSGKSVLVPKYALHTLDYKGKVVITNPKTPATIENAKYAAQTLDVELGSHVGYQHKGAPIESKSEQTKLLFSTDGAVSAQLLNDPEAKGFDIIIVDEAHERATQIDFLLYLLKQAIKKNKKLKVIIMSATINAQVFKNYFAKTSKFAQIDISGTSNYPIKEHFLKEPTSDFMKSGIEIVKKIVANKPKGDIIFFVNSKNMGKQGCEKLLNEIDKKVGLYCNVLASGITLYQQDFIVSETKYKTLNKNHKIKVVLSTNIGESSITIKGVYYVIESGYQLEDSYDPETMSRQLLQTRISKAQAKQRRGRSGRTQPGEAFNIYTEDEYSNFLDFPRVAIEKSDISDFILRMYAVEDMNREKLDSMLKDMITVPDKLYVDSSITLLTHLNILNDDKITDIGKIANSLKLDPKEAITLMYSFFYDCRKIMSYVISIIHLSNGQISSFYNKEKTNDKTIMRKQNETISGFYHRLGDIFTILKIYKQFQKEENKEVWCAENFLNFDKFNKIEHKKEKLYKSLRRLIPELKLLDITVERDDSKKKNVISCLKEGFKTNIAVKKDKMYVNSYPDKKTTAPLAFDSSILTKPNKILYIDLANIMGRKKFNMCTVID